MHVLIASSSFYRQSCYREMLEDLGHEATAVSGGIECVAELRRQRSDVLLLEAPLLWGGSDGVLSVLRDEAAAQMPVVLICLHRGNPEWFGLSRFRVDDFLVRFPTLGELRSAIERCAAGRTRLHAADRLSGFASVSAALPLPCELPASGAAS